jgi:hypothetical protein
MADMNEKIRELKGANVNVVLKSLPSQVVIDQDDCPGTSGGKCIINNVRVCKHFRGVKVTPERPDIVLCACPEK